MTFAINEDEIRGRWLEHQKTQKYRKELVEQKTAAENHLLLAGLESTDPKVRQQAERVRLLKFITTLFGEKK